MRKVTSISINDPDLWKRAKKHCIDAETSLGAYIEDLITRDLNKKKQ